MATDNRRALGVSRDANLTRIRRTARRFRPGPRNGENDPQRFATVEDTSQALRDRARRLLHDLPSQGVCSTAAGNSPSAPPAAPWVTSGPVDLMRSFATHLPGGEHILAHIAANFSDRHVPKSHPVREVRVDLSIGPEAAAQGGRIPIDVPVAFRCGRCEGTGSTGFMTCPDCDGHALRWDVSRVDVLLAPPVRDGTVVPVTLRHLGVRNLLLRVHVRVAA